ncbi:MAG: hypothetical protein Q9211_002335 [Gyalolechia sp. 1 TL-2023]
MSIIIVVGERGFGLLGRSLQTISGVSGRGDHSNAGCQEGLANLDHVSLKLPAMQFIGVPVVSRGFWLLPQLGIQRTSGQRQLGLEKIGTTFAVNDPVDEFESFTGLSPPFVPVHARVGGVSTDVVAHEGSIEVGGQSQQQTGEFLAGVSEMDLSGGYEVLWYRFIEYWGWIWIWKFIANGMESLVNRLGEKGYGMRTQAHPRKGSGKNESAAKSGRDDERLHFTSTMENTHFERQQWIKKRMYDDIPCLRGEEHSDEVDYPG